MIASAPQKTTEKTSPGAKPRSIPGSKSASIIVWLLVIFFAADAAFRLIYQGNTDRSNPFSQKLEQYFTSDMHPDLVLLGSSIALSSSFESDSATGIITDKKQKANYLGAVHLSKSIEATTGKKFDAINLACFGAMTDYTPTCVAKMVEFQKVPKVIIWETVSRDLFDASMPRAFESPYNRCMSFLHPRTSSVPAPIQKIIDWFMGTNFAVFASTFFTDQQMMFNPERLRFEFDSMLGDIIYVYSQRLEISRNFTDWASRLLDRQATLTAAVTKNQIENKKKNPFAPISHKPTATFEIDPTPQLGRFENEKLYLIQFLKLCKLNNICLIIVNMPVQAQYEAMVPTPLKPRWPGELIKAAKEYGFEVIDLNDQKVFTPDHFLDMSHLNAKGSLEVNARLSREIARRHLVDGL